jgi:ribosomal 50S subunit-associated protein YjgA (DUF615 family)
MAVYKIVELGDPVLREKARAVPEMNSSILKLIDNLADTWQAHNCLAQFLEQHPEADRQPGRHAVRRQRSGTGCSPDRHFQESDRG